MYNIQPEPTAFYPSGNYQADNKPQHIGTPTISGLVDTQEKIAMETLECLKALEGKLTPILREYGPANELAPAPREPLTPLASRLRDNRDAMVAVLTRINSIISRLDL